LVIFLWNKDRRPFDRIYSFWTEINFLPVTIKLRLEYKYLHNSSKELIVAWHPAEPAPNLKQRLSVSPGDVGPKNS
jgi:hypothetical protein